MLRADLIDRAKSALGKNTVYRLGAGAPFTAPRPGDEDNACDCSGFVCWVLGISRHQPDFAFLKRFNGGWMNTDGMVWDSQNRTGLFDSVYGAPDKGDIIVYPGRGTVHLMYNTDAKSPLIGHVGIVVDDKRVIHCSNGNYKTTGDAIQITPFDVFLKVPFYRYIRFTGVE